MDDEVELMLGVRALNHVGRPALLRQPERPRHFWPYHSGQMVQKTTVTSRSPPTT
jgi:hypothetical protein